MGKKPNVDPKLIPEEKIKERIGEVNCDNVQAYYDANACEEDLGKTCNAIKDVKKKCTIPKKKSSTKK